MSDATKRRGEGLLREARDYIREIIKELGPCDHSVNVCVCPDIALADRIDAFLNATAARRDGAEGTALADEIKAADVSQAEATFNDGEAMLGWLNDDATPPKPAPDAPLEAVEVFISTLRDNGLVVSRAAFDAVEKVRAALSPAPVPPADGVGEFKTCRDCEMRRTCLDAKHCAGPSHAQLKERFALSPLPAVAGEAEPVAWRMKLPSGEFTSWFNGKPPKFYSQNTELAYASTPVRGEREALIRDVITGAAKLHTHDHALALKIADDAILSLQSGAGEWRADRVGDHAAPEHRATPGATGGSEAS